MYVTYTPDGDESGKQKWEFKPGKVRSSRQAMIEKHLKRLLGEVRTFEMFKADIMTGLSVARRVMVWHLKDLDHPGKVRIEDVDPLDDEILLEYSKQELEDMRASIQKSGALDEMTKAVVLEQIDEQIVGAEDDGGKAQPSPSSSDTDQP